MPSFSSTASSPDDLSAIAFELVGDFHWSPSESGSFVDFEQLELRADGTYTAKVDARLLNPAIRCFGAIFMLPEEGRWNAFKVSGKTRIRVRPTTGRSRVYACAVIDGQLALSRRGEQTTLFFEVRPSAAASGTQPIAMPMGALAEPLSVDDLIMTCA